MEPCKWWLLDVSCLGYGVVEVWAFMGCFDTAAEAWAAAEQDEHPFYAVSTEEVVEKGYAVQW